jgi:hypothetical protein
MKVFASKQYLLLISAPTLREYTEAHVVYPRITVDWSVEPETFASAIHDAIDALDAAMGDVADPAERKAIEADLSHWHDDLRRAHLLSNRLAIQELRSAIESDAEAVAALESRSETEIPLWILAHRETAFRNVELYLAFQAKSNGKYWKKHAIQPGLAPTRERADLEAFSSEVSKLYQKVGGGKSSHVEVIDRAADGSIQLAIYVEGPITALAHFSEKAFSRITTRVALETAIVYHPTTGQVETIVKGGAKNHAAVLQLFGTHIVKQEITPEEIQKQRFNLNALRDGLLEPRDDWSDHGVDKVRLRRATFSPIGTTGVNFQVEASPQEDQADAIALALSTLKYDLAFASSFNMTGASVIVYMETPPDGKAPHFSFDLYSSGSSTIKNLSEKNQPIANAVLTALDVI